MAHRFSTPFSEPSRAFNPDINPYLKLVTSAHEDQSLPIKYGEMLRGIAGTWRSTFPITPNKLILEIGCHLGKTICDLATDHPDTGFIGADITFKRVYKTAEKAHLRDLANVQSILFNARFTEALFAPGELDGIVLFFPDPWTKERKAKNRLITPEFARQVNAVLKEGGFIWFKTDQKSYFETALTAFKEAGLSATNSDCFIFSDKHESTFERKFRLAGEPTYACIFNK